MYIMFLAADFEESEAIVPLDLLRRADIDVKTVSINDNKYVTGSHGITVKADMTISEIDTDSLELVILPGGPGTSNLDENQAVRDIAMDVYKKGGLVAAICAAPMVLGKLGILEGKKAACYPGYEKYLKGADTGSDVEGYRSVRDGNVITATGIGEAHTFAYHIIDAIKGKEAADRIFKATRFLPYSQH